MTTRGENACKTILEVVEVQNFLVQINKNGEKQPKRIISELRLNISIMICHYEKNVLLIFDCQQKSTNGVRFG